MAIKTLDTSRLKFIDAYDHAAEYKQYGQNALAIFALSIYLRIDDVEGFALNAISDGADDKTIDICYIDEEEGYAVVAQNYFSEKWGKEAANLKKAREINTGIAWLLSANEDELPLRLRNKAIELRNAIIQGTIHRIEIFYIHNCFESKNVDDELKTTANSTENLVKTKNPNVDNPINVSYKEMGLNSIEEIFQSREKDILIDDWINVPINQCIQEQNESWKAIVAIVPCAWVHSLYNNHGDRLFSANYRNYLGFVKQKGNINYQISQTVSKEPQNFFVFNNGITALTYEIGTLPDFRIRGISIINGAQTSGAIGNTSIEVANNATVLMRIVECQSTEVVEKIVLYNNTQNEIRPADLRSNDQTQKRLREEFQKKGISYIHRRSTLRTTKFSITTSTIAPILCAFHGEPQTSYRNSKEIFNDDETYQRVFPNRITASHVYLVKALSNAIDKVKSDLSQKVNSGIATEIENQMYETLKYSASKHFLFFIIGSVAEEILGRQVPDLFSWRSKDDLLIPDNQALINAWEKCVNSILPLLSNIINGVGEGAFYDVPRSRDLSAKVADNLKALIKSLGRTLDPQFKDIRGKTHT